MRLNYLSGLLSVAAVSLLCGCSGMSYVITPVETSTKLDETTVVDGKGWFPDKIAIVELEGIISNGKAGGVLGGAGENPLSLFTQELNKAADDSCVKAVVLRVNSPGGTVAASDVMYDMVKRFKAKTHKPVIAAIQDLGASGAYYVSCSADRIVAEPTSLVGSIGVIFETFNLQGTMDKLGVSQRVYKSAEHKDIGSWFRPSTPAEDAIMQSLVNEYYGRFKSIVTSNRPLILSENLTMLTDGRVFSGEAAKSLGLVDSTGQLEDAIQLAKDMAHSSNAEVIEYKRPYAANGGSIYAVNNAAAPQSNVMQLQLPEAESMLPTGFYYIWKP